jgi:hypothetical protein
MFRQGGARRDGMSARNRAGRAIYVDKRIAATMEALSA